MVDNSYEECRLEGGPPSFPEELRNARVPFDDLQIAVRLHDRWEYFERIAEFTHAGTPIFEWTMETRTAE